MTPYVATLLLLAFFTCCLARVGNWDACGGRLERALDALHRDSNRRNRLEDEETSPTFRQELHSAPLEITVSQVAVKLPQGRNSGNPWALVERCLYEPEDNSLKTRVVFNDLSVSGLVSLQSRDPRAVSLPSESCRMTLRLRRAGIEFLTSPIARGRGQMRIRTESSFMEPRFASIYAYGCRTKRTDKQIKRQDKWPPYYPPPHENIVRPASYGQDYDAAEPRESYIDLTKEDDIVIPNETRQPRTFYGAPRSVGIWRDNVWITKSALRKRRSLEVITPQDFAAALNEKSMRAKKLSEKNDTVDSTSNSTVLPKLEEVNANETKTNVKREGIYGRSLDSQIIDEPDDDYQYTHYIEEGRSWQSKEHIAREMEDVFLKSASQVLTRYIERQLHPAIKETLMLSMGYTISYG